MKKLIILTVITVLLASCGTNNDIKNNDVDIVIPNETNIKDTVKEGISEEELDKELNEIFDSID